MRQYSSDRVVFTWNPVLGGEVGAILATLSAVTEIGDISSGLTSGTFITSEPNRPGWRSVPNGYGRSHRIRLPTTGGTVTAVFDRESPEHMLLMSLVEADYLTRAVVGPILILDKNTDETDLYTECFLQQIPGTNKSSQGATANWVWSYTNRTVQAVGFTSNVVD